MTLLRVVFAWLLSGVAAIACEQITHGAQSFTVCDIAPDERIVLGLYDEEQAPLGQFQRLEAHLGRPIIFAMNAGMYHRDRRPVGLYIEQGVEQARLITSDGPGNFGLLPNGVFCIRGARADVIETRRFAATQPDCDYATQSGPMLVIDGQLHPRFLPDSAFRNIRNGVGTSADGRRVVFAISETPVTFHEFGTLYRDVLGLPQALYFDGRVSRLYAPEIGRNDLGLPLGPMVAVLPN